MHDSTNPPPGSGGKKARYSNPDREPDTLAVKPDGIPVELTTATRWVLWTLVWKANKDGTGKWDKVPKAVTGKNASSTDPNTWNTFDAVFAAYRKEKFSGIGFVLGDGLAGIDLDDVRNPVTGDLVPWAGELVTTAGTYADVSPSGTGVKLFGRGAWAGDWHKRPHPFGGEAEVYDGGRYFTVTGHTAGCVLTVGDIQPSLDDLSRLFDRPDDVPPPPIGAGGGGASAPDDELLERIRQSAQGAKFARLWAGDAGKYGAGASRGPTWRYVTFWRSGVGRTPTASTACFAAPGYCGRNGTVLAAPRPTDEIRSTRR